MFNEYKRLEALIYGNKKEFFDKEFRTSTPNVETVGYKNFEKIEIVKCLEQTPLPYSLFLITY